MDKTEPVSPTSRFAVRRTSQSKVPAMLFWILGAALLFRIATSVADHRQSGSGVGLVRWQPHEKAASAAQTLGKPVLYDFTAAWCAPCRRLDSEAWEDPHIAATINGGFFPSRVVDRQREEGKNPQAIEELQRRYSVNGFPTLVVADPYGRQIARLDGYPGKDRVVAFLEDAKRKAKQSSLVSP